jgi:hypothetical protein
MINYTDVEKLLAVHSEDPPVLSLYLEVPLDPPALHGLPARASDLLNSAAGGPCGPAGPDAGRVLAHARQVVRRVLEDRARDWLGHCVAIFLCAPAGLAEAIPVGRMGRVDDRVRRQPDATRKPTKFSVPAGRDRPGRAAGAKAGKRQPGLSASSGDRSTEV